MSRKDGPRFADLVGRVRRLDVDTVHHERPRPPARRRASEDEAPAPSWSDALPDDASLQVDDYHRAGVQHGILRKLRRGQFALDDELDLHGLTLEQARAELAGFLERAGGRRLRCVRIIHGKGMSSPGLRPVLKPNVRHWLRQDERVLAYTALRDAGGGSGALLVLLRAR